MTNADNYMGTAKVVEAVKTRLGLDRTTRFEEILEEVRELHAKKQADYGRTHDPYSNVRGSEDFGIPGWVGSMVRGNDKMRRLQKAARGGSLRNESVEDSMLDLIIYTIIALDLFREEGKDGGSV